ncbi:MAG: helix-turn-helix transcriptional regulator [Clostridia bacterium]|nr:helix-turn-helix transcriptional regulator [Clostridia bacterium]
MKVFQEKLKELRKEKNLMQKTLAEILQTTNSSISDWECGRSQPDLATLAKMAYYFDVSTDYLLGLEDETGAKIKPKLD